MLREETSRQIDISYIAQKNTGKTSVSIIKEKIKKKEKKKVGRDGKHRYKQKKQKNFLSQKSEEKWEEKTAKKEIENL